MTIPFEKLKARLLANPKVKAEYDALAPEFEICRRIGQGAPACRVIPIRARRAHGNQPIHHRSIGKRANAAQH